MKKKIAVIDDEEKIVDLLKKMLEREQYDVVTYTNTKDIKVDEATKFDLILLDIMMSEESGMDFLKRIRQEVGCPIILLTAKSTETDKVIGLLEGADDYITKPFGKDELLARVQAHLRRENREQPARRLYLNNNIVIDFDAKKILVNSTELKLTGSEYKICEYMVKNRKRVFSREEIYQYLYYDNWDTNAQLHTVTEFISSIRKKFAEQNVDPIETIWGIGYQWK